MICYKTTNNTNCLVQGFDPCPECRQFLANLSARQDAEAEARH